MKNTKHDESNLSWYNSNFDHNSVVVTGKYQDKFSYVDILTKCPSKYQGQPG